MKIQTALFTLISAFFAQANPVPDPAAEISSDLSKRYNDCILSYLTPCDSAPYSGSTLKRLYLAGDHIYVSCTVE